MLSHIHTLTTPFIFNVSVNCYLVQSSSDFILIDTAKTGQRQTIEKALHAAGCHPGQLRLIILTHGDFDHCGNAAYLRQKFQTKVAMHVHDTGMVEHGDMFWNRKQPNFLMKGLVGLFFRLSPADRFKPDVYLQEGDKLTEYGFDAQVIELPGHSKGNIGILTTDGALFCGDLLANTQKPTVWSIIDDQAATDASVKKLAALPPCTVYPGHGKAFRLAEFLKTL